MITRVRPQSRRVAGYGALALLAFVPPLLSSPGRVSADTKSYLTIDPGRLLERAPSMWDPNIGFGTVTHQTIGYLFPMGPYYWTMDRIGAPDWVTQRLWLGALVFAAALGVLYLSRQLGRAGPGVVVAALAYALSPYSLHYSARLSVLLMPWAALGFLLGLVVRALREGGWRAPALFALTIQVVGGVNATALVFAGVAPALWIVWSVLGAREHSWRRGIAVVGRVALLSVVASAWWISGLATQGRYGINILRYTETVAVVARTSTPNEVLRGLGYWFFYGRDRLGPWIEGSTAYTQNIGLIALGYGLAALALLAAVTVRWRHRGYFVWLLLVGTVIAVGAHPYESPTPLGAVFKAFATTSTAGLALRSTPRAVPLVTLAAAMLLGAGVDAGRSWLQRRDRPRLAAGAPVVVVALTMLAFPPLWNGHYYGDNLLRDEELPGYWYDVARDVDSQSSATRVLEVPGSDFAAYRWGDTVDPITPGLIDRPYVARELIPYGSAPSADLLNAFDRRLQEGTADPRGLGAMLRRMGVGTVVVRNDLEWERYNLVRPRELARALAAIDGLSAPREYGPRLDAASESPPIGDTPIVDERSLIAPTDPFPATVVVFDVDDPTPIVRAYRGAGATVVSGDGEGLMDALGAGAISQSSAVFESASLDDAELADLLERDPDSVVVVTDGNRRRGRRWSTLRETFGETETAGQEPLEIDLSDARLPVFPDATSEAETVVEYLDTGGPEIATIRATGTGNPIAYTPEDRPARAFDGDLHTSWKTSAFDRAVGDRIELTLGEEIATDRVTLVQVRNGPVDRFITRVRLSFDDADSVDVDLDERSRSANGQVVEFAPRTFRRLTATVLATNAGDGPLYSGQSAVGFAEIVVEADGARVRAREVVRVPTDATDAVAQGADPKPVTYVFSRLRVEPVPPRYDEELSLDRRFEVPRGGAFSLDGDARIAPNPYDRRVLEPLLGIEYLDGFGAARASDVMPGCPLCNPAFAFDEDPTTAWQPPIGDAEGSWIEVSASAPRRFDHLDLTVLADGRHSLPERVRVEVDGEAVDLDVPVLHEGSQENGTATVHLPFRALVGTRIRISFLSIDARVGSSYYDTNPRDLPLGVAATGIVATRFDSGAAGFGPVDLGCRDDLVSLDGVALPVRVTGDAGARSRRDPMRVELCSEHVQLDAGSHTITTARGVDTGIDIDRIVFRPGDAVPDDLGSGDLGAAADAAEPVPATAGPAVDVLESGRTRLRVAVDTRGEPTWLVLGQSHNSGWAAHVVGGDSLGAPMLVDGYANGWKIEPTTDATVEVVIEWQPQRRVRWALLLSIVGVAAAIAIAVAGRLRAGRSALPEPTGIAFAPARGGRDLAPWPALFAALGVGAGAAIVVQPWVGVAIGVLVVTALMRARARVFLAMLAPVALAAVGAFIAMQQFRYEYAPIFEWPTLFPRVRTWGWIAAIVPAIVWIVDRLRGMESVSTDQPPTEPPSTGRFEGE